MGVASVWGELKEREKVRGDVGDVNGVMLRAWMPWGSGAQEKGVSWEAGEVVWGHSSPRVGL